MLCQYTLQEYLPRRSRWVLHGCDGRTIMTDTAAAGWTGGQKAVGDIAPALAHYTDKVLFDDVWERSDLSKRDRSLVTVAALTVMGNTDQLRFHLDFARQNGVTETELIEALTHLAFYAGWPKAMAAVGVARDVFGAAGLEH
jgi:4-carboxymuconolactone decarboxylase